MLPLGISAFGLIRYSENTRSFFISFLVVYDFFTEIGLSKRLIEEVLLV